MVSIGPFLATSQVNISKWLNSHPKTNTVVLVANHVFRSLSMFALMEVLPGAFIAKVLVSAGASLFYRVTVERFCPFRFALASCAGGLALKFSLPHLTELLKRHSIVPIAKSLLGVTPLIGYLGMVTVISYKEIKEQNAKKTDSSPNAAKSCCSLSS